MNEVADPNAWYLVKCVDCDKLLKVQGQAPAKPICLHCDIIRAAPEDMRETIRKTLLPIPEDVPAAPPRHPWFWPQWLERFYARVQQF